MTLQFDFFITLTMFSTHFGVACADLKPLHFLQLMAVDVTVFHFESNESSKPKLPILCFFQPAPPINITHDCFLTCVVVGNRQRALQLFPRKQHICEVEHHTQHITSQQAHQSRLVIFLVAATALFYLFGFDSQASAISIDTKRGDILSRHLIDIVNQLQP